MEGFPLLPGYSFRDVNATKFHLPHKFTYCNGYQIPTPSTVGIGKKPLDVDSVAFYSTLDPVKFDPSLTYGRVKCAPPAQVLPHWVLYDKKCLTFRGFFKQSVPESPDEHYRVRHVNIIYFLDDDTITVMEPATANAGFPQGRLVKRGRVPKLDSGTCWHWKDLNIGVDLAFYGIVVHTVDCDLFTREFLASQGVELNATEDMPPDPMTLERKLKIKPPVTKTGPADNKLRRFLEYDTRILRFYGIWREQEDADAREYVLYYFLADDGVSVQEVRKANDGREPFPLLLKRTRLPKNWKDIPESFPSCYMERSDDEVSEFYNPRDFVIGETIFVLGRRFLLFDCDPFTRNYYKNVQNMEQPPRFEVFKPKPPPPEMVWPPHVGVGSPEDSIMNCYSLHPKAPRTDFIRYCYNANKYLRYELRLKTSVTEDKKRPFVLGYHLADGKIRMAEIAVDNSGFLAGAYLKSMCVPKPGANPDNPEYYTPADFYIGAVLNIYTQKFVVVDCDLAVYRYVERNQDKFPKSVLTNLRNHFAARGALDQDIEDRACALHEEHEKLTGQDCDNLPLPPLPMI